MASGNFVQCMSSHVDHQERLPGLVEARGLGYQATSVTPVTPRERQGNSVPLLSYSSHLREYEIASVARGFFDMVHGSTESRRGDLRHSHGEGYWGHYWVIAKPSRSEFSGMPVQTRHY